MKLIKKINIFIIIFVTSDEVKNLVFEDTEIKKAVGIDRSPPNYLSWEYMRGVSDWLECMIWLYSKANSYEMESGLDSAIVQLDICDHEIIVRIKV